jgi:flagellar motor protein MotB
MRGSGSGRAIANSKGLDTMASLRILCLPALALSAALVGCNDSQKAAQADLLQQNEDLAKQLEAKNDSLNSMGEQLSRLEQTNASLEEQLAECTRRAAAPAPVAESAEVVEVADANDFRGIEGVEATVKGEDIHLTISNSLLFDSGKAGLKDGARRSLDRIASTVKEKYGTREVLVVGHTDTDPIRRTAFTSNYHLGFERAYAVHAYLGRKGVPASHMGLMSFGPDRPEASKDRSRRVEVIVTGHDAPSVSDAIVRAEAPKNAPKAAGKAPARAKTSGR